MRPSLVKLQSFWNGLLVATCCNTSGEWLTDSSPEMLLHPVIHEATWNSISILCVEHMTSGDAVKVAKYHASSSWDTWIDTTVSRLTAMCLVPIELHLDLQLQSYDSTI